VKRDQVCQGGLPENKSHWVSVPGKKYCERLPRLNMCRIEDGFIRSETLYQGCGETVLEKHYTANPWFIVHQCRWWVDMMFGDRPSLEQVK